MGTVFKRGKRWGINYTDPHGRQIRKLISPYRETAQRILNKIETDIAEDRYLDIKEDKRIVFDDFAREYQDSYVKFENKHVKNQCLLIKRLVSYFQGQFLHKIDVLAIRRYLSQRSGKLSPSTVNKDLTMLKCMFNRAIEWGYLKENPTRGIKKLQENNERCRWLTEEEQSRLLFYCHGLTRTIVIVAIKTGLRWGEIVSLKWRQAPYSNYIDFRATAF